MTKDTQNQPIASHLTIPMEELQQHLLDCYEDVHQLVCCHYFYRSVIYRELSAPGTVTRRADWLTGLSQVNG